MGKLLIGAGVLLVVAGVVVIVLERFGLGPGRLPGDFAYRGRNVQVFFPLGTSLLISVLLTLVLYVAARMRR